MNKVGVIVGAGEFDPKVFYEVKEELWQNDKQMFWIAADGGYLHFKECNMVPDLLIGDFDSLCMDDVAQIGIKEIIRLPREKDDTDLLAAIQKGLSMGIDEYHIFGALGGDFDHMFGNIQCLNHLCESGKRAFLYHNNTIVTMLKNTRLTIPAQKKGIFSIFSFTQIANNVNIVGGKYALKDATITNQIPIGVRNEFVGSEVTISVEEGTLLVYYQKERTDYENN